MQAAIKNGERSSASASYLAPKYVARPNLDILIHAQVTRVQQTHDNQFTTVEFAQDGARKQLLQYFIHPRALICSRSE